MALQFHPPSVSRWPDNPATMIARDGIESLDLGFAQPSLNGVSMIQSRHLVGSLPPIVFPNPQINLIQLPFGNRDYEARVKPPITTINWTITIPPDPVDGQQWESSVNATTSQVATIFQNLEKKTVNYPPDAKWKIVAHPLPSAAQFMAHVLHHEEQHVEDHKWLATQIIGPWDDWLRMADYKRLRFRSEDKYHLQSVLCLPGGYAETVERIARYWQEAIKESGDLYHRTDEGASPEIKILRTVGMPGVNTLNMELHLSIEPKQLLTHQPIGPHNTFSLKKMSKPIGGNEPKLTYGNPGLRQINAFNVRGATNSSVISVD